MQLHPHLSQEFDEEPELSTVAPEGTPVVSGAWRRRLLWTAGVVGCLLLLVFTPPLINVNRFDRQIARSMSQSLGRPVHLDNVRLHLLPVPGFTLENLVVSEDPAFGAEPTIRANTVEVTLRLGSLWRRPVEFSTVRFVEPSVNLVRNAQGHWNLADILFHASHVNTAPTAQRRRGPTPRFPYIEATGGRVNVKLGDQKMPYSLTDANFALWQPSPRQWQVRLRGAPARTDLNITDSGTLQLEGALKQGSKGDAVPLSLRGSGHDAPMGEATLLLAGEDLSWRGTVNLEASLAGSLAAATLRTKVTLNDLRRADFAAAHPLSLQLTCGSALSIATVSLADLACSLPDTAPQPLALSVPLLSSQRLAATQVRLDGAGIPMHWAMLWAALYSSRVPTDLHPGGTLEIHMARDPDLHGTEAAPQRTAKGRDRRRGAGIAATPAGGRWSGEVLLHAPPVSETSSDTSETTSPPAGTDLHWRLIDRGPHALGTLAGFQWQLDPVAIRLAPDAQISLSNTVSSSGYEIAVSGTASPAALLLPARYLPQLGDGLDTVLPDPPTSVTVSKVNFSCVHPWGAVQTCTGARGASSASRLPFGTGLGGQTVPRQGVPSLLAPHSLSPLDHAPRLGGTPDGVVPSTAPNPASGDLPNH